MNRKLTRIIYPICVILPIIFAPFLTLIFFNRIQYLDTNIESLFSVVLTSFGGTLMNAVPYFIILFSVSILSIFVSITLLFRIEISKTEEDIEKSRLWTLFSSVFVIQKKHWWHIMLGYFLIMMMLAPSISEQVLAVQSGLQKIENFQADFLTITFLVPVLIIARILSKLDIKFIHTDISSFIILVYVSGVIYSVFSGNQIPFEYLYGLVAKSTSEIEGFVMLYGAVIVGTFVCTFIDYVIMWKWKKPL